jgi:hypothetical protein
MPQTRQYQVFQNGVLISSTPYDVSDAQLRGEAAVARLIQGRSLLRQIRTQAQAASDATGALTLAQLTTQFRQLAGAVATLAQTLMDVELVLALQQDDGSD